MQTVLITGANGFVSWYLIQNLLQKDYYIVATGKGPSRLSFKSERLMYEPLDLQARTMCCNFFKSTCLAWWCMPVPCQSRMNVN
jgi:dTDP-4-dehydrorhamnose reductase